jgi:MFS family permease
VGDVAFDAMNVALFGFVLLAVARSFSVGLADVVSTVAWFLLATGIGGYFLGNVADKIGRKKSMMLSVFVYAIDNLPEGHLRSELEQLANRFLVAVIR